MIQDIIIIGIEAAAVIYLLYRFVFSKKKKGCETCAGGCSTIDFSKIDIEKTFNQDYTVGGKE